VKIKYDIKTDVNSVYWVVFIWMESNEVVEVCFDDYMGACVFAESLSRAMSFVYIKQDKETGLFKGIKAQERP